ncbi:hypothetical protein ABPG75_005617 [Micractinium tetrahymenae]
MSSATDTAAPASRLPGLGESLPYFSQTGCIYLDWNATTPVFPEVAEAMRPYLTAFGNPSSAHAYGRPCNEAVDLARRQVAAMVGAEPGEVHFTSCGTEADAWAIWGAVMAARKRHGNGVLPHVVSSCIEHPAVVETLASLAAQGLLTHTAVPVNEEGLVSPADVAAAIRPETVLVTVMHSNNEVGSVQPIAELAALARERGVLMHSDAAQSLGKVAVDVKELGVDMLTIVGHKFGAPKGVAALYIRQGVQIERLLCGGGQEFGRRAGTESVLLLVGLGTAAAIVSRELPATAAHMAALRDSLQEQLLAGLPAGTARVNGPAEPAARLPNTLSIGIAGIQASTLLAELSDRLAASAGAACHSNGGAVSAVLRAMGVPTQPALGTLRLSVGRHTTQADVDAAAQMILDYVKRHQGQQGAAGGQQHQQNGAAT